MKKTNFHFVYFSLKVYTEKHMTNPVVFVPLGDYLSRKIEKLTTSFRCVQSSFIWHPRKAMITNKRKLMPDKQAQKNLISEILLFYNESYEIK